MQRLLLVVPLLLSAAAQAQDWAFARDDYSVKLSSNDIINISLGTSNLATKGTFFTEVDKVGAILTATATANVTRNVNGSNSTEQQSAAYPFGFEAPVKNTGAHLVSLPFQGTPVKEMQLSSTNNTYLNLSLDITMVRLDKPKLWTKIAQQLIATAKTAALPANPFGVAAGYALQFANSTLTDALSDAGKDEKTPLGTRTLNFKTARGVWSGTYLLILDDNVTGEGYVNPNDLSGVCLYRSVGSGDTIMVGRKNDSAADKDGDGCAKSSYRRLTNPYVPIIIEQDAPLVPGGPHALFASEIHRKGYVDGHLAHCRMANITKDDCKKVYRLSE